MVTGSSVLGIKFDGGVIIAADMLGKVSTCLNYCAFYLSFLIYGLNMSYVYCVQVLMGPWRGFPVFHASQKLMTARSLAHLEIMLIFNISQRSWIQ